MPSANSSVARLRPVPRARSPLWLPRPSRAPVSLVGDGSAAAKVHVNARAAVGVETGAGEPCPEARRGVPAITLQGRRALVTGANSGVGESIARQLALCGARVAVDFVAQPDRAAALVDELGRATPGALALEADVGDARQVQAMFAALDHAWGGLDILVNNAGIDGPRALAWEADPADWERVLRVDLLGAFHCAREALRRMVPRRAGVVLNITSVHEKVPWSGYGAYTAAKAGLAMLTRTLAQEASPFGVRVVALAPGAIRTPINAGVWKDPAGLADLVSKIPLGRIGEPEEVARAALFLVSDGASYVTGSTLYVDGAMTDYPEFAHGG